ncbi:MAG: OapA N-terminal domain-containing protein [Nocardioides sp.]|uniref:OapA N-terminal domain-containing protein n=1 Tax=Nocardioides sp. TaxID=35761 RepID=UPI0039E4A383
MFGRLPLFHQLLIGSISLVVGVLAGLCFTVLTNVELAASAGAVLGGLAGVLLASAVVREHHPGRVHPARVRRR